MLSVQGNFDTRVEVNGRRWTFNPKCLTPAPSETPFEVDPDDGELPVLAEEEQG